MITVRQRGSIVPILLCALIIIAIGAVATNGRIRQVLPIPDPAHTRLNSPKPRVPSAATSSFIYALRYSSSILLREITNDGANSVSVAKLAKDIRDINILSSKEIMYIAGVKTEAGTLGKGTRIEQADISGDVVKKDVLFEIDKNDTWMIDELLISPDQKYIAWWEIKNPPGVVDHSQYASRTYIRPISGGTPVLVAESSVDDVEKYKPLFFDAQNRLYLDHVRADYTLYLGIERYDKDGNHLGTVLADGDYNSWPQVSPDGKWAVYTGYDSSVKGTAGDPAGPVRTAVINKNTLLLIDLTTDAKKEIDSSKNNASYEFFGAWSPDSAGFAYEKLKITDYGPPKQVREPETVWTYEVAGRNAKPLKAKDITNKALLAGSERVVGYDAVSDTIIFGSFSGLGNLGSTMASPVFADVDSQKVGTTTPTKLLSGGIYEYVAIIPKAAGAELALHGNPTLAMNVDQLKLDTFDPNPPPRIPPGTNPRSNCVDEWEKKGYPSYEACEMCPLYLYPTSDTKVSVKLKNAHVIWSDVPYDSQTGFVVTAKPDGMLLRADGTSVMRLDYDYQTQAVPTPTTGLVVNADDLASTLRTYAEKLGLTGREVDDFEAFWLIHLPNSPYYFVSHFSSQAVKDQLALDISPKPDTLIQVIMYFKPLTTPITVEPPVFEAVPARRGFTAVDFSGRIDR